jgi:hypothetical protein
MAEGALLIPQPKILLEGTHLTRKTDVAFALAEHPRIIGDRRRRWHIPLISAEWETRSDAPQTKQNPGWSIIDYPPTDEQWMLRAFDAYLSILELHAQYYWIVDRFHISTMAHQQLEHGHRVDLQWVDDRLAALGFVLVHLRRDSQTFEAARTHRLTYSENPHRYSDLTKYVREQDMMADLISKSAIPSVTVDVSNGDVGRIANDVLDWVESHGYLRPDPDALG